VKHIWVPDPEDLIPKCPCHLLYLPGPPLPGKNRHNGTHSQSSIAEFANEKDLTPKIQNFVSNDVQIVWDSRQSRNDKGERWKSFDADSVSLGLFSIHQFGSLPNKCHGLGSSVYRCTRQSVWLTMRCCVMACDADLWLHLAYPSKAGWNWLVFGR